MAKKKTAEQLRKERGEVVEQMQKILKESGESLTPEQEEEFDRLDRYQENLHLQIRMAENQQEYVPDRGLPGDDFSSRLRDNRLNRNNSEESPTRYAKGESIEERVARGNQHIQLSEDVSLGRYLRAIAFGPRNDVERRALGETTDSAGGFTVPDILAARLIDRLRTKTRVLQAGAVLETLDSDKHSFAKLTGDPVATWRAENTAVTEDEPTFDAVNFLPKTLAVLVKASVELLQDSINVEGALVRSLTESLGAELDRVALIGSGSGQEPAGVSTFANANVVSMGTNGAALTNFDPIVNAVQLLEDSNAITDNLVMITSPRTAAELAKLKDSTDQPLQRPSQIANIPVLQTTQMPVDQTQGTATDASSIYIADWSELVFGVRLRLQIVRLTEMFMTNLQQGFIAYLRADIQPWHEESFARIEGIIP